MHYDDPASRPHQQIGTPASNPGQLHASATAQALPFKLEVQSAQSPFPLPWIPTQTARAVHAAPLRDPAYVDDTDETAVVDLGKVVRSPDGEDEVVQLAEGDWSELYRAWSDLPRLQLPLREADFEPYSLAFERFLRPPLFTLSPLRGPMGMDIFLRLQRTMSAHERELKKWIEDGRVQPCDRSTMLPVAKWHPDAGLALDDLRVFAKALRIDVHVLAHEAANPPAPIDAGPQEADERQRLLKRFRAGGGRLPALEGEKGRRGALAELAETVGVSRQALTERLTRAIKDERAAAGIDPGVTQAPRPVELWSAWGRRKS